MPSKVLPKRKSSSKVKPQNEVVVLLTSSSGRSVGFIVRLDRDGIPFDRVAAQNFIQKENFLDALMDASFLPYEVAGDNGVEEIESHNRSDHLGNRFQYSLRVKDLTDSSFSEFEYFMRCIPLTEN